MLVCLHFYLSYLVSKSHLSCTILYCHLWPVGVPYFTTLSHKQHKLKKNIERKMFRVFTQLLSETFLILRKIQQDINVCSCSCKLPVILVRF